MANNNVPKDVLNVVKKKTGKNVTEQDIKKLASTVKPTTMQSETELRKLIQQVGSMVGVSVPESTVNEIVNAVKKSGGPGNLENIMKMMMNKNK